MDKSILEAYLKKASSSIITRGKTMFKQGNFKIDSIDEFVCKASVKSDSSSTNYKIVLHHLLGQITSSCTCPTEEMICKHQVVILSQLIKLKTEDKGEAKKNTAVKVNRSNHEIPNELINKSFIKKFLASAHASRIEEFYSEHRRCVNVHQLCKESIAADVKSHTGAWDSFKTTIVVKDKISVLSCTCNTVTGHLCQHEAFLLIHLSEKFKNENILNELLPLKELKLLALKDYGFTALSPQIEKTFSFVYDKDLGKYVIQSMRKLVLPNESSDTFKNTFLKLKNNTSEQLDTTLLGKITASNEEIFHNGFVLATSNSFIANLELVPVVGILDKAGQGFGKKITLREDAVKKNLNIEKPTEDQNTINNLIKRLSHSYISRKANVSYNTHYFEEIGEVGAYVATFLPTLSKLIQKEILYEVPYVHDKKSDYRLAQVDNESLKLKLIVEESEGFITLKSTLLFNNQVLEEKDFNDFGFGVHIEKSNTISFYKNGIDFTYFNFFIKNEDGISWNSSLKESALKNYILPLSQHYEVDFQSGFKIENKIANHPKIKIYITENETHLQFQPLVEYTEGDVNLFSEELLIKKTETGFDKYERDSDFESFYRDTIQDLHPDFEAQSFAGNLSVSFDTLMKNGWFYTFFEKTAENNISVLGFEKIKKTKYSPFKASIKTNISSKLDWFDLNIEIAFGEEIASLKDVQKAILKKENFITLKDGKQGILPDDWIKKHENLFRSADVDKKGELKISKMHFILIEELFEELDDFEIQQEITEKKQRLLHFKGINKVKVPSQITATLRPYQEAGFNWLSFLDEYNWGGCLADDMGLGKTLQIITFLQHQVNKKPKETNLIIVPTSLIFNWERELQKFAPSIKFLIYTGSQRDKDIEKIKEYQLVITTYGLIINDIEHLNTIKFNYVVLDESQAIKNTDSLRYKAVMLLKAKNRLAMTGTPVENNTFDLYAQMNFTNPGLLGNVNHFKKNFSDLIDKKGDQEAATLLRKIVQPFLLRRTKDQVAKDLPNKTEDVIYCEMGSEQRKVYNTFRDNYRNLIGKKIDTEGLGKSSMIVLDALLKLRQICNSPALLNTKESYGNDSVKIEELVSHLTEKTGNHKVLVFSQFVEMLKLIEKELTKQNILYEYLDGQTRKREEKVKRFQEEQSCRVFLISIKAGGVGLNLTQADYVYIVDPWWNPAVEAQAIDRTHRIGQTKKVFAYRMICKDTIEEKILQLQQKKKKVSEDVISADAAFYKQLEKEDILDLFS